MEFPKFVIFRMKFTLLRSLVCIVCCINIFCSSVQALNDSKDLIMSEDKRNALERLNPMVVKKLPEEFMKTNFYLIRWIRKANLNVDTARNLVLQTADWRTRNNISSIIYEDFSDLQADYPMSFDGVDKLGRPVLTIDLGDWNLRGAVISGMSRRVQRYLTMSTERTVREIIKQQQKGKYVTRAVVLVDNDNVNLITHGCPLCIAFLAQWTQEKEAYYPDFTDETVLINVPAPAVVILNAVRAVSSPDLRSQIKSFDTNKSTWKKYLDARIAPDQRRVRYGGTKTL